MASDLVVFQQGSLTVTQEEGRLFKEMISSQSPTDSELKLFFYECERRGVHPLDKLIIFTKRSGKVSLVTTVDYMRMRAEASGVYAGSDDAVFQEGASDPSSASVTVWKIVNGIRCPFTATARWEEYRPADMAAPAAFMWKKMPHTMLAKCAEALALRKAFPGQLHGLYTNDEMAQAGVVLDAEVVSLTDPKKKVTEKASPKTKVVDVVAQPGPDDGYEPPFPASEPPASTGEVPLTRPYSAAIFKAKIADLVAAMPAVYEQNKLPLTVGPNDGKILASIIDQIYGDKGPSRHIACTWLIGTGSTKEMTPAQVKALFHIMGIKGEPRYESVPSAESIEEFRQAYQAASAEAVKA